MYKKIIKQIFYFFLLSILFQGCGLPDIDDIKEIIKVDRTAPILSAELGIHPLSVTSEKMIFTFSTTEEGEVLYENNCRGNILKAEVGENSIIFDTLSDGLYDFCTVTIVDKKGNSSNVLEIPHFTIAKNTLSILEEIMPIASFSENPTPHYTFRSSKAGKVDYLGACQSTQDEVKIGLNTIVFNDLKDGFYSDCRLSVRDKDGVDSAFLEVSPFTIDREYQVSLHSKIAPERLATLDIEESSGLLNVEGRIFTHNDSGDEAKLYEIDLFGNVVQEILVQNAKQIDWEDITEDEAYVYIGDIGNNMGNRKDLVIYKISKKSLLTKSEVVAEEIMFSYGDQEDFTYANFTTPYDAEALISYHDKLYLFTKNWKDKTTKIYPISKEPGVYVVYAQNEMLLDFMITAADFDTASNSIVLIGYESVTADKPHVLLLKDFDENLFFSGSLIDISLDDIPRGFRQIEGVSFDSESSILITSESLSQRYIGNHPKSLFYLEFGK